MGLTKIEWTDYSFNPWWGCVKVSMGCEHCYAETFSKAKGWKVWGRENLKRFFPAGGAHWEEPMKWNRKAVFEGIRKRVFCASMADVFEIDPNVNEARDRLFKLIEATPMLDWLLLTKRPQNMIGLAPKSWSQGWPSNVVAMTSIENQLAADRRIPELLKVPAKRFGLSMEPLLEQVTLMRSTDLFDKPLGGFEPLEKISWVIVGGESGHAYRPFNPDWARLIRDLCRLYKVPFFMKQLGGTYGRKDIDLFPDDLKIREFYK